MSFKAAPPQLAHTHKHARLEQSQKRKIDSEPRFNLVGAAALDHAELGQRSRRARVRRQDSAEPDAREKVWPRLDHRARLKGVASSPKGLSPRASNHQQGLPGRRAKGRHEVIKVELSDICAAVVAILTR
jgi:hypothetical protein